jgi:hypothetical protein
MNKILSLYNEWTTKKNWNESFVEAHSVNGNWQGKSNKYNEWTNTKYEENKLMDELYKLLDDKIYQLPSGNFLVPCYDDCMDTHVKVMEVLRTSEDEYHDES